MRIFIAICILLIIFISIFINKKILHSSFVEPTFIFSNIWLSFIFLSLLTIQFQYNYAGILYILSLCLLGFTINLFIGNLLNNSLKKPNYIEFKMQKSSFILLSTILLGMMVPLLNMRLNGFSISNFFDFNAFLEMNNQMAVNRYSGVHQTNSVMQILLIFEYFSPIVGGYHFASSKDKKNKLFGLMSFLPAICNMLIQNTKSELLSSIFLFISTMIIGNVYLDKELHVKFRNVVKIIILIMGTFLGLILTMLFRIGTINEQNVQVVLNKFLVYALGQVPTFDNWLGNYQGVNQYGFGTNTFIGIFNFFGFSERIQGVYSEYILIEGFPANIYTAFRGMIEDFGILGSIIFFVLIMGTIVFAYYSLTMRRNIYISSFILLNGYFFIFYSFIISSWSYMSYLFAIFLFLPYLMTVRVAK